MQYLVSFALLVAFVAWMVGVYNHLVHLRKRVCSTWEQWRLSTHRRNSCLVDFAASFAAFLPQNDSRPQHLRQLAEDSERALSLSPEPRWGRMHGFLGGAEQLLRKSVADSVELVELSPRMQAHEHIQCLCSSLSASLYQQDQYAALFNHAARDYNAALSSWSARLLGPVFGFEAADPLDSARQSTRSS